MYLSSDTNTQVDRAQATTQLNLLGYKSGENVYMRAFLPKDKASGDKGRKADRLFFRSHPDAHQGHCEQWQAEGRGIYFVVNGGGHLIENISEGRAIFYEHDRVDAQGLKWLQHYFPDATFTVDEERSKKGKNFWFVPKDVQRDLWLVLDLPEPTFQVDTGGKSVHSYWVLDNPVPIADWETLQTDLLDFADADRSLKNANRVMRLAGTIHPETGDRAQIISASGNRYSFEALREIIPHPPKNMNQPAPQPDLKDLLEGEIYPRLTAENFYGTRTQLNAAGRMLRGVCPIHAGASNPTSFCVNRDELTFFCHSCGAAGGPVQFLWQIGGGSGSPTGKDFVEVVRSLASEVGVEFPEKKFERRPERKSERGDKVAVHPAWQPLGYEDLVSELNDLAGETSEAAITYRIAQLGKTSGVGEKAVWKIFKELEEERDRKERNLKKEIEEILKASNHRLNLEEVLPKALAQPINLLASRMALRPEAYMMALLCQANSLLKAGTTLELLPATNWKTRPNLQVALVAEASVGKTPIAHAIIDEPMEPLREAAWAAYEKAEQDYQEAIAAWNRLSKEEQKESPQPKKPEPRIFHFSPTSTMEGMLKHLAKFPDSGHMVYADELKAFFDGQGQYKGGNGTDKSTLLSCWSGKNPNGQMRAADGGSQSFYFPKPINLGIYGGIQPAVFSRLMGGTDPQGEFARFLYVEQPFTTAKFINLIGAGRIDLQPVLSRIYQSIEAMPMREFTLSHEALKYHALFHDGCGEKAGRELRQALRAILGKLPDQAGRLAIALHVISANADSDVIEIETVKAAVKIAKFCYSQIENLLEELKAEVEEELPANLAKIVNFVGKRGSASTNEIRIGAFYSKNRPSKLEVKNLIAELEKIKFLREEGGKFTLLNAPHSPHSGVNANSSKDLDVRSIPPHSSSPSSVSSSSMPQDLRNEEEIEELRSSPSTPDAASVSGANEEREEHEEELKTEIVEEKISGEPDWQPGEKLLLQVHGMAKKSPVELVDYKFKIDGSLFAILRDETGATFEWPAEAFDKISRG